MDTLLEDLSAVIQIFLAGIIIFKSRSIRKYTESWTANYRLIIIETAFFVYAFSSLFHISLLGGSYTPIERGLSHLPHIVLIISHGFGTLFFILLAEVGLLYFLEQRLHSTIKKFSNFVFFVLSLIIFSLIVFHVMASLNYTVIKPLLYSTNIFIFFHILQISIIILVSLIILSRIITIESNKNPLFLSRKYPFGTGIVLLTLANLFHTTTYLVFPGSIVNYFEHIGLVLAPVALLIILKNIRSTDTSEISNEDTLKSEGGIIASINIILKHAYFDYQGLDIGEKDILYYEMLSSAGLESSSIEGGIGIEKSNFFNNVRVNQNFLYEVSLGLLSHFSKNPHVFDEVQAQNVINYLSHFKSIKNKDTTALKKIWIEFTTLLSSKSLFSKDILEPLRFWGPEPTFAFFEKVHSTGVKRIDEMSRGIRPGQLVLNIRAAEIKKKDLLSPIVNANLKSWRNVIYISSSTAKRIKADLDVENHLAKNRLKIASFAEIRGVENIDKNLFKIGESSETLLSFINGAIKDFSKSAILLAIDLNPLLILESPKKIRKVFKNFRRMLEKDNLVIYSTTTSNMDPIKLDILKENSDLIFTHEIFEGGVVSSIFKSDFKDKANTLDTALYKILTYVRDENQSGKKVNYSDIMQHTKTTAVTTRKRLKLLFEKDLIQIEKVGRTKNILISSNGKEFLYKHTSSS